MTNELSSDLKTAINKRFQSLYEAGMEAGVHGHYETMFHAMHEAYGEVLGFANHSPVYGKELALCIRCGKFSADKIHHPIFPGDLK